MRDSKTSFSPVVIKQEPRDSSEQDASFSTSTTITNTTNNPNNNNNGYSTHSHLSQALPVDLRAAHPHRSAALMGRRSAPGGSERGPACESTEDFVAQIARRVREESGLPPLELTPVTGLGPLADLKTPSLGPVFPGPSSVENGGKSRGEYACGECSSRFDTARDYRAHCLTHQVLKAESMLRSSRGGSGEREGRDGEEEDSPGSVFGGLGSGGDTVVSFTCEDCNTRFSSRDTYAMHMLIRAKNEACFPSQSLMMTSTPANLSTAPAAISKTNTDSNTDSSSSNMPPPSPASSLTGATSLPGSSLLLNVVTPPNLKLEAGTKGEGMRKSGGQGEGSRHAVTDNAHSFLHTLGLDMGHLTSYSAAWWSKYMPWMAGMGLVGGASSEAEGSALLMVCYLCGELFSNRDSLAMHVLFHTRDMPASSLPDPAASAWKKPLPALSSLPTSTPSTALTPSSSSSTTPNTLLLGHAAALRQLQHRGRFNSSNNNVTATAHDLRQPPLSPTEAAVASAAAAAVAAMTPTLPSATQASLVKALDKPEVSPFVSRMRGGGSSDSLEGMSLGRSGLGLLEDKPNLGSSEEGHLNLSPPQRGASAPIPTTSASSSPLLPGSEGNAPFKSATETKPPLGHARPLSADHVVLRHHRPLLHSLGHGDRRHSGDHPTPTMVNVSKASPHKHDSDWRNGSDMPLQPSSAFNVYRLQRLKKLRLARGPYRRPGIRGRPPMTIFGTAGRRPVGAHAPALSPSLPASGSSSDPVSPTIPLPAAGPPPSSSASRLSSMVQLLTSQGHAVSACSHCELLFGDKTLYQLHMGLHNVNNPWQCNACGCVCSSRLHFATHTLHY